MKPHRLIGVMVSASLASVSFSAVASESFVATVVEVGPPPPSGSGYIRSWRKIVVVKFGSAVRTELVMTYVGERQTFPVLGAQCRFDVHLGTAGGSIGRDIYAGTQFLVIDRFHCPE